jgi:spore maturation protein CgeB
MLRANTNLAEVDAPLAGQRVLFCGPLFSGSTADCRRWGFRALGATVESIDYTDFVPNGRGFPQSLERIFGFGPNISTLNNAIYEAAKAIAPTVIWCEKPTLITSNLITKLKQLNERTTLISFSPDDQMNNRNQSRHWRNTLSLFDVHVTTKPPNVAELLALGARRVELVQNHFSTANRYPIPKSDPRLEAYESPITFVGAFEKQRADSILALAKAGIPVRVWGPGWRAWAKRNSAPTLKVEGRSVWDEEYLLALNACQIGLCFLRHENRDVATSRSVEIPACGTFMLAERTPEHLAMYTEGVEAEFFSNTDELIQKAKKYLNASPLREAIALRGLTRAMTSPSRVESVILGLCKVLNLGISGTASSKAMSPNG